MGSGSEAPPGLREWSEGGGGPSLNEATGLNRVDGYAAVSPDLPFRAGVHVHYQESVLPLKDGVTKLADLPKEMGGSGVSVSE